MIITHSSACTALPRPDRSGIIAAFSREKIMLGRFKAIRDALTRTRQTAFGRMATLLGQTEINEELWDELEALLIQADVGVETTMDILERARAEVKKRGLTQADQLRDVLKLELRAMLMTPEPIDW